MGSKRQKWEFTERMHKCIDDYYLNSSWDKVMKGFYFDNETKTFLPKEDTPMYECCEKIVKKGENLIRHHTSLKHFAYKHQLNPTEMKYIQAAWRLVYRSIKQRAIKKVIEDVKTAMDFTDKLDKF